MQKRPAVPFACHAVVVVVVVVVAAACATPAEVAYPERPSELQRAGEPPQLWTIRHTPDVTALLDAAIEDILTRDLLRLTREFYCAPTVTEVALTNRGATYAWPVGYTPRHDGVRFTHLPPDHEPPPQAAPKLGLDVRRLEIRGARAELAFCIFHVGHEPVMGACYVVYSARRTDEGWQVQFVSARD